MNARAAAFLRAIGIIAGLGTTACDSSPTLPQSVLPPDATVTGLVLLHDAGGVRPYANIDVSAWVQTGNSGWRTPRVITGADGRYNFTLPAGALIRVQVNTLAAYQPCVTQIASVGSNASLDVHVIADPTELGAHLPSELLAATPTLSGTVFETTALGRQPVPGARVQLDMFSGLGDVSAQTLTDSDGRYVLCGLRGFASTYVWALKSGYKSADVGTVQLTGDTIRDIEIQR